MKRLSILQLVPGMIVAQPVLSYDKQQVLPAGTVLTDKLITKLDLYGIITVYVQDTVPDAENLPIAPREPSYSQRIKSSESFQKFKTGYDLNVDSFRTVVNDVLQRNAPLDVTTLLNDTLSMLSKDRGHLGIMDMLHNMREYDDSTFAHCLNVGLICNVFATWLKFDQAQVELATACGLLHDVGKLLVPHSIITKPGKLSDEEYAEVQKHPLEGYQLLCANKVDEHVRNAALMHHERTDGSGYPMHLSGEQIDKFARIVAIADVYDAMTAARVYRGPQCPFKVIEIFESEGFRKYDVEYLLVFLENVVNSYIQNRCLLSDGTECDIIYINKSHLSKPIVQRGRQYINLAEHKHLSIVELL